MQYKYITENNLFDKQSYMYSAYEGLPFLEAYRKSRMDFVNETAKGYSDCHGTADAESYTLPNRTGTDLHELCELLKKQGNEEVFCRVNAYVKSFEVRKRIYSDYDAMWKPAADAAFDDYDNYLLLADCAIRSYHLSKSLKYFSCLLKLTDTLLSVNRFLGSGQKQHLKDIIEQELELFKIIAGQAGLQWEEAT